MSGGGGKGGSSKSSSQVKIPKWLEDAARANMARADKIAQIGYTPYYGPDVAAFNPTQQAAFQNTADAASAFGMAAPADPMAGMPQAQTFANGLQGYSSQPMFQQSIDAFKADRPGQFDAMSAPFINPITGAAPVTPFGNGSQSATYTAAPNTNSNGFYSSANAYGSTSANGMNGQSMPASTPAGSSSNGLRHNPLWGYAKSDNPMYNFVWKGIDSAIDANRASGMGGGK